MIALGYWTLWLLFNALARLFLRYRAMGQELVPKTGGVLIAANHASFADIPLLGCGLPRRAAFMGREDLFPLPGLNWLIQKLGWIPIRQDRVDREGFGRALRLIQAGETVVIFPEGGRTHTGRLRPGKPGLGMLVAETGCPVVPAYLAGTFDLLPMGARWIKLHPVTVTFGKPIDFSADARRLSKKEFYRHVSRTVMAHIAELGGVPPPTEPRTGTPVPQR